MAATATFAARQSAKVCNDAFRDESGIAKREYRLGVEGQVGMQSKRQTAVSVQWERKDRSVDRLSPSL